MKNLQNVLAALCIMVLMVACSGSGGSSPEDMAVKAVKSLYAGDIDGLKKCMSKKTLESQEKDFDDENAKQFLAAIKEANKDVSSVKAIETNLSEDGNSATVKVEVIKGDETSTEKVNLVKEDGKWFFESMSFK